MNKENKEFLESLSAIGDGSDTNSRRTIQDVLQNSQSLDNRRIQPLTSDINRIIEAYNRMRNTSGVGNLGDINLARSVQMLHKVGGREAVKERLVGVAIRSMTSFTAAASIIKQLSDEKGIYRLCDVTLGLIDNDKKTFWGRLSSKKVSPILLGDEGTTGDMRQVFAPYANAIELSKTAKQIGDKASFYYDSSTKHLDTAAKTSRLLKPEESRNKAIALNDLLVQIHEQEERLKSQLGEGVSIGLITGLDRIDEDALADNLRSAKKTGQDSKILKDMIRQRKSISEYIRNQINRASMVHLNALNAINFSTAFEWAKNYSLLGEILARISLAHTTLAQAATANLALRLSSEYLLNGGVTDAGGFEKDVDKQFSAVDRFKEGYNGIDFLDLEARDA